MRLSARNLLKGKVVAINRGPIHATVKLDIGNGVIITSSITRESIDELGVAEGETAYAVVKASNVMIAVE